MNIYLVYINNVFIKIKNFVYINKINNCFYENLKFSYGFKKI